MPNSSPDHNSCGFLAGLPDPIRYDYAPDDPENAAYKIAAQIPKGGRVLDVGCGSGVVSAIVQKLAGCELTGIEPDHERVVLARQRGLNVIEGFFTLEKCSGLGPFDAIIFADVLEHMSNPGSIILIAKQLLARDGCIVASVPNIAHWSVRFDLIRGRFKYEDCGIMDATHLRWFTHDSLKEFFERLGFEVCSTTETMMAFLPAYNKRRPWRWLSVVNKQRLLRIMLKWKPKLFGCQIVLKAIPKA